MKPLNTHIFRTHGIRGIVDKDIDTSVAYRVGLAFSAYVKQQPVMLSYDHRISSPELAAALKDGLQAGGCDVNDLGLTPKGLAMFGSMQTGHPLVYVSASHLPAEWNGFKFMDAKGCTFDQKACADIRDLCFALPPTNANRGNYKKCDFTQEYLQTMRDKIGDASLALKLLVDCGNGTAVKTAPQLLDKMGFNVTTLFGEIDGRMPNRPSELTANGLQQASAGMTGHDLGLAFDGDADRVAFIAPDGKMIDLERFAVVFLKVLTESRQGPIVANVSCGDTIASLAQRFGCKFYRVPTGAPHMINKAMEVDAIFGMESSGHLIVPSIMSNDDAVAIAAFAAKALSQLVKNGYSLRELLESAPTYYRANKVLAVADGEKEFLMQKLENYFQVKGIAVDTLDGLRIVYPNGWTLFRASGTEPALRLFAEADSKAMVEQMISEGMQLINELHGKT